MSVLSDASDIKFGSSSVTSVYLGSTSVWGGQLWSGWGGPASLPSGRWYGATPVGGESMYSTSLSSFGPVPLAPLLIPSTTRFDKMAIPFIYYDYIDPSNDPQIPLVNPTYLVGIYSTPPDSTTWTRVFMEEFPIVFDGEAIPGFTISNRIYKTFGKDIDLELSAGFYKIILDYRIEPDTSNLTNTSLEIAIYPYGSSDLWLPCDDPNRFAESYFDYYNWYAAIESQNGGDLPMTIDLLNDVTYYGEDYSPPVLALRVA